MRWRPQSIVSARTRRWRRRLASAAMESRLRSRGITWSIGFWKQDRGPKGSAPHNESDGPRRSMRIVVAEARVPFAPDGAGLHAQSLVAQLRRRGHDVESVALPFRGRKSELL